MTYTRYPAASAGGDASSGDVTDNPTYATQAALTYYVDAAGSDTTGDGSLALPWATIQKAITALPRVIDAIVTINVGAGTFTGALITGFNFRAGGCIALVGTQSAAALTGLMTGTIASATAGSASSGTWATATVTGAGWTVDELRGSFIRIDSGTGAGQLRPISSNTATVITTPGAWTAPTGATFTIVAPGTAINAGVTVPADYIAATAGAGGFKVFGNSGGGVSGSAATTFSAVFIDSFATGSNPHVSAEGYVHVRRCKLHDATGAVAVYSGFSQVTVEDNVFTMNADRITVTMRSANRLVLNRNVVTGSSSNTGLFLFAHNGASRIDSSNNSIRSMTRPFVVADGASLSMVGDKIDQVTPGGNSRGVYISSDNSAASPQPVVSNATLSACDISNCVSAIHASGQALVRLTGTITGTGNTTALALTRGAEAQVSSASTITGTTEVSLDGAATTLAVMRAQTPKVLHNADYGTKVYE